MRCQLCDGPVVGGRCKSCGMPYKNDAVLYHVNEDRKTHDRHASEKAREELRKRLAPSETVKRRSSLSRSVRQPETLPGTRRLTERRSIKKLQRPEQYLLLKKEYSVLRTEKKTIRGFF